MENMCVDCKECKRKEPDDFMCWCKRRKQLVHPYHDVCHDYNQQKSKGCTALKNHITQQQFPALDRPGQPDYNTGRSYRKE